MTAAERELAENGYMGMPPTPGVGRIIKGVSNAKKVVVIGENMAERVIPYAKKYGYKFFKPRGTNPSNWMKNQAQWIRRQIKDPWTEIIDIGADPARATRSEYYLKELEMIRKYLGL